MFRKMRRFKQEISEAECIEVMQQERRGVLSVLGDDGYPYGVPVDYLFVPEDRSADQEAAKEHPGKIYIHGARQGHKIDAIRACDKVSFCVCEQGYRKEGDWAYTVRSVVAFGRIHIMEDHDEALEICRRLCHRFTQDEAYIQHELDHSGPAVQVLEIDIEHMTGKRVHES